jgi:Ca2+-transporting ATPase
MESREERIWHSLPIDEVAAQLGTDRTRGLTAGQVAEKQAQYGPNELAERPRPGFLARLWNQLNDFLIWILIISAIVSAIIGWNEFRASGEITEFIDAGAIMTIVVLNAIMGLVQEGRAEEALGWTARGRFGGRVGAWRPGGLGDRQLRPGRRTPGRERQSAH